MNETLDENMTVEQFLELQFQNLLTVSLFNDICLILHQRLTSNYIVQDFKSHTKNLIGTLRQEYSEGVRSIKDLMNEQKKGIFVMYCKNLCTYLQYTYCTCSPVGFR